ncbi:MAG TPA: hypothetical protein VFP23_10050 [Solirubrobacterales bacterium]|nr:hypothetical protein [Solirubrobacterales bacterium]
MAVIREDSESLFFTRLEHNEHKFVERCNGDTDGIVINLRFDSPGKHGRLKRAAIEKRLPFVIDIETWRLPFLSGPEDESFGSDVHTPLAAAVPLPLSPEVLGDQALFEALVRAAVQAQAGALYTFAPYFLASSLSDPWLEVNLRALAEMRRIAPRQPLAAWIYVTFEAMMDGLVPYLADRYRDMLPPRSLVVLTVSDIRAGERTSEEIATYLEAVESFRSTGLQVIADRASEISVVAIASGARGCMLGNRIYRTAPASPIWDNPYNPAIKLRYFDGARVEKVDRQTARARADMGKLDCRYAPGDCGAIKAKKGENVLVRLHASHEMRDALRRAERLGSAGLRRLWRDAPLKQLRDFAQAMALVDARSQEA